MKYVARVEVRLKPGHTDPEGETTREALVELKYNVKSVRVSKVYEIVFEADSVNDAKNIVEEMCKRLLANPVKDDYRYYVEEAHKP
ncbi:MAG: phosphoribosylformylglycinamidine synthase subunit PurS [Candidatus Bathyarchaeota archaeon]|nr:phosphoribosylformylglycinamidine synthase subunit PurS [Candidatus Bathyarchaeota archaeon]